MERPQLLSEFLSSEQPKPEAKNFSIDEDSDKIEEEKPVRKIVEPVQLDIVKRQELTLSDYALHRARK
jgi:hypothetical protein